MMKQAVKQAVYSMEADVYLPEAADIETGEEVDTVSELDQEECEAVEAILGFDPRTIEDEDENEEIMNDRIKTGAQFKIAAGIVDMLAEIHEERAKRRAAGKSLYQPPADDPETLFFEGDEHDDRAEIFTLARAAEIPVEFAKRLRELAAELLWYAEDGKLWG